MKLTMRGKVTVAVAAGLLAGSLIPLGAGQPTARAIPQHTVPCTERPVDGQPMDAHTTCQTYLWDHLDCDDTSAAGDTLKQAVDALPYRPLYRIDTDSKHVTLTDFVGGRGTLVCDWTPSDAPRPKQWTGVMPGDYIDAR